jgi:hypothetical protein
MRTELTRTVTSNTQSTSPRANVMLSSPTMTTVAPYMVPASTSFSPVDFQSQMLTVLNDTFAKLLSVISVTSTMLQDTKTALIDSKS